MSPEAQRIAIARACGWEQVGLPSHPHIWRSPTGEGWRGPFRYAVSSVRLKGREQCEVYPDFLSDLNAMHEAEKVLFTSVWRTNEWESHVRRITQRDADEGTGLYERIIRATAAQRAEAFLKTIGKWEHEKLSASSPQNASAKGA